MTTAMALLTNYPIALASGGGFNAFFTFTICAGMGIPWRAALGLVFYSGLGFFLLSVSGLRQKLIEAIPHELKLSIMCGIGLFIAFIGLKSGGLIIAHPATLVTLGPLSSPPCLLVLFGIILGATLIKRNIQGSIILTVLIVAALGLFIPSSTGNMITNRPEGFVAMPDSLAPTFMQMDLGYLWSHFREGFMIVFAILFMDLFDNMGTLIGVCRRANLLDKDGNLPKMRQALLADAGAAMIGAGLGTSTVCSFVESAAGVEAGGRTGLTGITVAVCFLLALFFNPIIKIIPAIATAPVLVIVGVFMMQEIAELDLKDVAKALPSFMTMIMMPLTFSISDGIAVGFITYVGVMLGLGRAREVTVTAYVLTALFLTHYFFK
jgi:AGZA family xanthine/uracil permease-like MFS transporter